MSQDRQSPDGFRGAPSRTQVEEQRDRILTSPPFASAARMQQLLRHLVDEALASDAPVLKETAIAIDVFGRDESFDPRLDSIVRVEAGRLRAKLREYYTEGGADDPVRIEIPKGGYVPVFSLSAIDRGAPAGSDRLQGNRSFPLAVVAAVAAAFATAGIAWLITGVQDGVGTLDRHGIRSLAVLPLHDWSETPRDYFSESMTDALITRLAERSGLRVTSLGSVLPYKDSALPSSEIAARLGVDTVIEGGVLRSGGDVRITASLIDPGRGVSIWSRSYTRPMSNVLALQDEIVSEIAANLGIGVASTVVADAPTIEPGAYEAFLKGTYWRNRLTENGFNRGILFFQEAIALQPDYAEAYAGLAACHCQLGGHGIEVVVPDVAMAEAQQLATRALELDSTLAVPNAVLGIIKFKYEWDSEGAEQHLLRAMDRNPSLFEAYLWRSQVAEGTGRREIAVEQARIATRINPLSLSAHMNLGWQLLQAGEQRAAMTEFQGLVDFDPDFWGGHWGLGQVHRQRGNYDEAIAELETAAELGGGHTLVLATLGFIYGVAGRHDAAVAIADELVATSRRTYISPFHISMVYVGLGDHDTAFEWLERAVAVRARSVPWLAVTPEMDALRADPRYEALLARTGIGWAVSGSGRAPSDAGGVRQEERVLPAASGVRGSVRDSN